MDKVRKSVVENFIRYTGPFVSIVCFIIILAIASMLNSSYNSNLDFKLNTFEENWVISISSEEEALEIPFSLPNDKEVCTIKNTLPKVVSDEVLVFKYQHQITKITIGNEVVYETTLPSRGNIKTTLGTNILSISMKEEYSNKDISVDFSIENISKKISLEGIYLCSRGDYLFSIFNENILQLLIASLLLITGIIYLIIYITCKIKRFALNKIKVEYFLSLFVFSFSVALWILSDLHLLFIMTGHLVSNDILSYFSLMLVPVGFVYIVYYIIKRYRKIFIGIEAIYCLNIIIQTFLFTIGIVDLANMLIITQGLLLVGLALSIVLIILSAIKGLTKDSLILVIAFAVFMVFIGICIIGYALGPVDFNYNLYFLLGMSVIAIAFGYIVLREFIFVMGEHALMEQTKKYAYSDALTGLGNRRAYDDAIVDAKSKKDPHLAIIGFDVNYLKKANDTLGHNAGDELLIGTAELIKKVFFDEDGNNVFRTGGDEFAAIVHISKDEIKMKMITLEYEIKNWRGEFNQNLSIAMGYAVREDYPDISLEELAIKADEEMYKNKRARYDGPLDDIR